MFHSTQATREYFAKQFDKYNDNYSNSIDQAHLKLIFNNMTDVTVDESLIHYKIAFIENKYFPDESSKYGLFRLCTLYFNKPENKNCNLEFIKLKSKWHGAVVCDTIDDTTTHCIVEAE